MLAILIGGDLVEVDRILFGVAAPAAGGAVKPPNRINLANVAKGALEVRQVTRAGQQGGAHRHALFLIPIRDLEAAGAGLADNNLVLQRGAGLAVHGIVRVHEGARHDIDIAGADHVLRQRDGPGAIGDMLDVMIFVHHQQRLEALAGIGHGDCHRRRQIENADAVGRIEIGADDRLLVDRHRAAGVAQLAETALGNSGLHVEVGLGADEIVDVDGLGGDRQRRKQRRRA